MGIHLVLIFFTPEILVMVNPRSQNLHSAKLFRISIEKPFKWEKKKKIHCNDPRSRFLYQHHDIKLHQFLTQFLRGNDLTISKFFWIWTWIWSVNQHQRVYSSFFTTFIHQDYKPELSIMLCHNYQSNKQHFVFQIKWDS